MEALQMTQENRSMQDLGNELSVIHEAYGISYQSIADAAQVNRSYVSTLANRGAAPVGAEGMERLWNWVDDWKRSQGIQSEGENAESTGSKQTIDLIRTKDLLGALGDRRTHRHAGNGQDHRGGHSQGQAAPGYPHRSVAKHAPG